MLLIKNGYVMDPKSQTEGIRDVLIEDKKIVKIGENLLADMGAEESAHLEIIDAEGKIIAHNLHQMGLMTTRDYSTYMDIFELAVEELPQPDLLIYLKGSVPTLISQIQRRGRAYEMSISEDYLSRLNLLYENWIKNVYKGKLLMIDVDKEDFVLVPENLNRIISQVESFM